MKSIVNTMEEPMSYYSYKRRKDEIREAIDYNTEEGSGKKFKPANAQRGGSCMRAISRVSTLDTLPELRGKYGGVGETLRNAKSELPGLEGTIHKAKVRLKINIETN
eukprot:TRINITY_DN2718_c0_g1_i13.p2 TRINITY_DN2718_c0_g1~~TRINITY_DN2718_c0_g1_i13.p2  ORF type:complete len:107 (+),score=25.95 TRINITY_DN2718_c0_g1_i13:945-1265(+)